MCSVCNEPNMRDPYWCLTLQIHNRVAVITSTQNVAFDGKRRPAPQTSIASSRLSAFIYLYISCCFYVQFFFFSNLGYVKNS